VVAVAIDVTISIDLGRHYESCSSLEGENMISRIDVKTGLDRRRGFLVVDERRRGKDKR
jgi:hypothetical protein